MSPDTNQSSSTGAAASAAALTTTLSKSQKKRMKRNASKARKEAMEREQRERGVSQQPAQETAILGSPDGTGAALNPHVKLRSDLVSRGYLIDDVERAIDDMWNLQLPYDEFDSVLAYLEARRAQEEADERAGSECEAVESASTPEEKGTQDEKASDPPAASSARSPPEEEKVEEEVPAPTEEESPSTATPSSEQGSALAAKTSKPKKAQTTPPMDLASKLELVSNFDNLSDAISALSEWVSKAAKGHEIIDLCDIEKTNTLPTICRRAILECMDPSEFESFILPGFLSIIASILQSFHEVSSSSVSSVTDELGEAMRQARCAIVSGETVDGVDLTDTIVATTSSFVISAVGKYVEYNGNTGPNGGVEKVRRLEEEIDALASSIVSNSSSNGVMELMSKRDCHKLAAEKSSTVVDIAMFSLKAEKSVCEKSANGSDPVSDLKGNLSLEEGRNKLLTSLLGDEYDVLMTNRAEYNALKVGLEDARSATASQRHLLMQDRNSYQSESDQITLRLDELRKEMEVLEGKNETLKRKMDDIDESITALDDSCGDEVKEIKSKLTERGKAVQLEDDTRSVVKKLGSFESSLLQLSASSNECTAARPSLADKVSNKMGIYLVRMRNYFKAESDIVEFICSRVKSLENGLKDLEREIDECAVLGMTTNVNQMTQQLSITRRNIDEDNSAIAALRGDAEQMRENLMRRLEEYDNESGEAFTPLHVSVLNGIASAMTRIGLENDGGLGAYLLSLSMKDNDKKNGVGTNLTPISNTVSSNGYDETPTFDGGNAGNGAQSVPVGNAGRLDKTTLVTPSVGTNEYKESSETHPHMPQKTDAMPKLSWAAKSTSARKPIKSLLDIQKEELSAKAAVDSEN